MSITRPILEGNETEAQRFVPNHTSSKCRAEIQTQASLTPKPLTLSTTVHSTASHRRNQIFYKYTIMYFYTLLN